MPDLLPFERRFRRWIDREGMGWERIELPLGSAGHTTAYRFSPAGPPRRRVVALHGAGNDALFGWIGHFRRLLQGGAEVLTFDLPGHGRWNRGHFSCAEATAAARAAVELFRASPRAVPVHAVGVSLGGSILLAALPGLQAHLASAVLMVAPLRISLSLRNVLPELGPGTLRLLWSERADYGWGGLIPSFGPFKREIYPLRLPPPVPPGAFGYVDALNRGLADLALEERARAVTVPTLLVYGDRDRIVPAAQGERIARSVAAGALELVRGGTHLSTPMLPSVVERVAAWLERAA